MESVDKIIVMNGAILQVIGNVGYKNMETMNVIALGVMDVLNCRMDAMMTHLIGKTPLDTNVINIKKKIGVNNLEMLQMKIIYLLIKHVVFVEVGNKSIPVLH